MEVRGCQPVGWSLAVPGQPVIDVIQISTQEYRECHEAELKKTDSQTNSHYGDDIVVQPLLEALRAALGMQKTCKGRIASGTHPQARGPLRSLLRYPVLR